MEINGDYDYQELKVDIVTSMEKLAKCQKQLEELEQAKEKKDPNLTPEVYEVLKNNLRYSIVMEQMFLDGNMRNYNEIINSDTLSAKIARLKQLLMNERDTDVRETIIEEIEYLQRESEGKKTQAEPITREELENLRSEDVIKELRDAKKSHNQANEEYHNISLEEERLSPEEELEEAKKAFEEFEKQEIGQDLPETDFEAEDIFVSYLRRKMELFENVRKAQTRYNKSRRNYNILTLPTREGMPIREVRKPMISKDDKKPLKAPAGVPLLREYRPEDIEATVNFCEELKQEIVQYRIVPDGLDEIKDGILDVSIQQMISEVSAKPESIGMSMK